ncbi:MAG: hypothetical protein L0K70_03320 [Bifidobacterium crudilactis]|nr:hypothetical protein [Bifidobacterium crudilactis]
MAWYEIHPTCGHDYREQIYGTNSHGERDYEVARLSARLCPACWKQQQAEANASVNQDYELPALEGSEKQIAWAENIRAVAVTTIGKAIARGEADRERFASQLPLAYKMLDFAETATSAGWWIDSRENTIAEIAQACKHSTI